MNNMNITKGNDYSNIIPNLKSIEKSGQSQGSASIQQAALPELSDKAEIKKASVFSRIAHAFSIPLKAIVGATAALIAGVNWVACILVGMAIMLAALIVRCFSKEKGDSMFKAGVAVALAPATIIGLTCFSMHTSWHIARHGRPPEE